ncbi:MAG: sulfotransferase [Nitrospiraceae bacterium]|nr:sulfotransferase [Nitrospiraceae bacterium]
MLKKDEFFAFTQQPLAGGTFSNWLTLLAENSFRVHPRYAARFAYITMLTSITAIPRAIEKKKYDREIEKVKVEPVFIVGHFRGGTTYLHNLMSRDIGTSYVSTFHTMLPDNYIFMEKFFKKILSDSLPPTRPMDDVEMAADYPYEEEYAVANVSRYSFYHGWYFPRKMREYFDKYVLFDVPDKVIEKWKKLYAHVLKKAAYKMGKKRVLLKNPPNTGRIKQIVEMYPDAKFIHLYRNPYKVFNSTMNLYKGIMPLFSLQEYDMEEIEENIFYFYSAMYEKFFRERHMIKDENYVEIRYEDFVKEPLKTLEHIYKSVNLPGFEKSEGRFKDYIASQRNYKPNNHPMNREIKDRIYSHWHDTIDRWEYE